MGRIRTIKPEFWRHEALSDLPEATHILAAALLNYADDEGYFNANPKLVQAECSPLREPSVSTHDSLNALSSAGYIRLGDGSDGRVYGHIVKFTEHQRVNRPTPSKIKDISITWRDAVKPHPQFTESSLPEKEQGTGKGNREQGKEAAQAQQRGCGREDRALQLRAQVIAALGMKGDELNTGATFPVKGMDQANWPMRLAVWDQHGLTDDQIVLAIKARFETARKDDPAFRPTGIKYFDGAIADFARDLKSGKSAPPGEPDDPAPPQFTTPDHIAKNAAIRAEWETVKDKTDPEAKARKLELAKALNVLREEAGV